MQWLSKNFIREAQDSPLAGHIPKAKIPEILRLVESGDDVVFRLLDSNDQVIEVSECELPIYLRKARAYWQEKAPVQYRNSIISMRSTSSASSCGHSIFSNKSRGSIASTNTNASIFSLETPFDVTRRSPIIPESFKRSLGKPFICPTCGQEFMRFQDLKKHVKEFHESPAMVFQCYYCEKTSGHLNIIEAHCQSYHPAHALSVLALPSYNKSAYGCSFCETPKFSLEEYLKCMERDQKQNSTLLPLPTKRLRALLRQCKMIRRAMKQECARRQLDVHAWEQFTWDDDICDEYSRQLEYRCDKNGEAHWPNIDNIHRFTEQLLANARESTGRPIAQRESTTGIAANSGYLNNASISETTNVVGPAMPHYNNSFTESPISHIQDPHHPTGYIPDPSNVGSQYHAITTPYIEDAAKQGKNQPRANLNVTPAPRPAGAPKRHASLDSTSHPENSSRAKRHPPNDKFALPDWSTDRPDSMVLPEGTAPSVRPSTSLNMSTHPVATSERNREVTDADAQAEVAEVNEISNMDPESAAFDGNTFGDGYGFDCGTSPAYGEQSWYDDRDMFGNEQNFGIQYNNQQYHDGNQHSYNDQQSKPERDNYQNHIQQHDINK